MKSTEIRVKEIITKHNLNITKLSYKLGISRETLSRVINGSRKAGKAIIEVLEGFIQEYETGMDIEQYIKNKQSPKQKKEAYTLKGNERWVTDYEEKYTVNFNGEIYSVKNRKYLKGVDNGYGYLQVTLSGKRKYIHRIVGSTFLNNPANKEQTNHIDGNKKNNSVSNLEWNTPQENMRHAFNLGLINKKSNGEV